MDVEEAVTGGKHAVRQGGFCTVRFVPAPRISGKLFPTRFLAIPAPRVAGSAAPAAGVAPRSAAPSVPLLHHLLPARHHSPHEHVHHEGLDARCACTEPAENVCMH